MVKILDQIGVVGIGVDVDSLEIVLVLETGVGKVSCALTAERAALVGVSLIRESGKTFTRPTAQKED